MIRIFVVALAGCGRVAFDPALDASASCTPALHDEDRDGVDDACDGCPHVVDDQRDGDGDGLGDACDPRPNTAGDRIALFDPFTAATTGWTFAGPHVFVGDHLTMDARAAASRATRAISDGEDMFEMGGRIGTVGTAAQQLALQLNDLPRTYYCELYRDIGVNGDFKYTFTLDGTSYTTIDAVPLATPIANNGFLMRMRRTPETIRCESQLGAMSYAAAGARAPVDAGAVELQALDLAVDIHYFVWIRSE